MRTSTVLLLTLACCLNLLTTSLHTVASNDLTFPLAAVQRVLMRPHSSSFDSPAQPQTCSPTTHPKNSSTSSSSSPSLPPPSYATTLQFHPDARPRRAKHGAQPLLRTRRAFAGISRKRRRSRKSVEPRRPGKVHVTPINYTDEHECVGHEVGFAGRGFTRVTVCGGGGGTTLGGGGGGGGGEAAGGKGEEKIKARVHVYEQVKQGCVVYRYPMPLGGVIEIRRCVSEGQQRA